MVAFGYHLSKLFFIGSMSLLGRLFAFHQHNDPTDEHTKVALKDFSFLVSELPMLSKRFRQYMQICMFTLHLMGIPLHECVRMLSKYDVLRPYLLEYNTLIPGMTGMTINAYCSFRVCLATVKIVR